MQATKEQVLNVGVVNPPAPAVVLRGGLLEQDLGWGGAVSGVLGSSSINYLVVINSSSNSN